jgi:DNA-binding transcriptional ArsR family regulator
VPPQTDRLFSALANPNRLALLRAVLLAGEASGPQLQQQFGFSQPTLSKHVKPLIDEGLLERSGGFHGSLYAPHPREAQTLLRAAAEIQAAHYGALASDALELAEEMRAELSSGGQASERTTDAGGAGIDESALA